MATQQEIDLLKSLYAQRTPLKEIAAQLDWEYNQVKRLLRKLNILRPKRIPQEKISLFIELVKNGESWKEAASRVGISSHSGNHIAHKNNLPRFTQEQITARIRQRVRGTAGERYLRERLESEGQGWPPLCSKGDIRCLQAFFNSPQPLTIAELGPKIGFKLSQRFRDGVPYSYYGGIYGRLAKLAQRGILLRLTKHPALFALSETTRQRRQAFLDGHAYDPLSS